MLGRSADASVPPPVDTFAPLRYRLATKGDERAVAVLQDLANEGQLSQGVWATEGVDWQTVGAAEIAGGSTEMALANTLVAEADGRVIGMLNFVRSVPGEVGNATEAGPIAAPFVALRSAFEACIYLRAMAVDPASRGMGVAGGMLDLAENVAARERTALGVIVHESNERLIRTYERRGYRHIASMPVLAHVSYPIGSTLIALRREAP